MAICYQKKKTTLCPYQKNTLPSQVIKVQHLNNTIIYCAVTFKVLKMSRCSLNYRNYYEYGAWNDVQINNFASELYVFRLMRP